MTTPGSSLRAPLLWLLLPFMAGIAFGEVLTPGRGSQLLLLGASGLLCSVAWRLGSRDRPAARIGWAAALVGAGVLQGLVALHVRSPLLAESLPAPREGVVEIAVDQLFSPAPGRKTIGGLARITATDPHLHALLGQRVYLSALRRTGVPPAVGGRYRIRGVLAELQREPETTTGFHGYLANMGIRLTLTRAQILQETRAPGPFRQFCAQTESRLGAILRTGLAAHPGETSIFLAMLLGEKAALSSVQQQAFMRSGTFHVFSISGLHVGVIATAILSLLQLARLSRRTATLAGLLLLWLYVQVTGASVPAERAFLMIAFLAASRVFRLPGNSLAALAAAALLTLWLDPRQLFHPGFQLSYTVVAAIILMAGPLATRWRTAWQPWRDLPRADWGRYHHVTHWLGEKFIDGWAATWAALPASVPAGIGFFGLFSPGALLANLLIIPLSTFAIIAGFVSLLGGLCGLTGLSLIFNHAAVVLIRAMDTLLQHGVELPGVYFLARFSLPGLAPIGTCLVLAVMATGASVHWPRRWGAAWWPLLVVTVGLFFGVRLG